MTDESKPLTAFEAPRGLFQFKTMSLFLVNAGASFCRLARFVLQGLQNIDMFVDEMWTFSLTWKDHMKSLRQVLIGIYHSGPSCSKLTTSLVNDS